MMDTCIFTIFTKKKVHGRNLQKLNITESGFLVQRTWWFFNYSTFYYSTSVSIMCHQLLQSPLLLVRSSLQGLGSLTLHSAQHQRLEGVEFSVRRQVEVFSDIPVDLKKTRLRHCSALPSCFLSAARREKWSTGSSGTLGVKLSSGDYFNERCSSESLSVQLWRGKSVKFPAKRQRLKERCFVPTGTLKCDEESSDFSSTGDLI